jgi:hypothetical protein
MNEPRQRRPTHWRRRALQLACAAVIVGGCGAYYRHLWSSPRAFSRAVDPFCVVPYCDFTLFYYKQAQVITAADAPIHKYFYSPTFALLLTPIGHLPYDRALLAWTWVQALSLLLLVTSSVLLLQGFPGWSHALVLLLTLTSYPMLNNWKWGQANTTFIAFVVLALALCQRGRHKSAAFALSLVVAARYYPALYALAFIARSRRKVWPWLIGFSTALLVALPVLAMGALHAWHFYLASAAELDKAYSAWIATSRASQYLPSVLPRVARAWHHKQVGSRAAWQAVAAALAGCNVAAVCFIHYKRFANPLLWSFCFIALSTPLLVPTSWPHYFVYLPLAQTFFATQLAMLRRHGVMVVAGALLCWLPSVALSSFFCFEHVQSARVYAFQGLPLLSNMLLLLLAYMLLAANWLDARTATRAL